MDRSDDRRGVRVMNGWGHDVRMALRAFRATPMVTAIAVASLALAIGANTAIFSIANSLLLNSLPVRDPGRLVHVTDSIRRDTGEIRIRAWSNPFWEQIQARPDLFESATAWSFARFDLAPAGETQLVDGIWADGGFFETLGVQAAIGRTFTAAGRSPGRRSRRRGGRAQLRLLAAAVRRPAVGRWPDGDAQRRAVHDHRRHAARSSSVSKSAARSTSSCRSAPKPSFAAATRRCSPPRRTS